MNPMTPTLIDFILPAITLLHVILAVWALVTLAKRLRLLGANSAFLWMLAIIVIPVIGSIAWLSAGKDKPKSADGS